MTTAELGRRAIPHGSPRRWGAFAFLASMAVAVALLAAPPAAAPALAAHVPCTGPGLNNPGFEDGHLDVESDPACWNVVPSPAPDTARVVDAEGPGEFASYADLGVTVTPRGEQMLRLGGPKRINERQQTGNNAVFSDPFLAQQTSLKFQFRLLSWEHRGDDIFGFNLVPTAGPGAPLSVTFTPTDTTGVALPSMTADDVNFASACPALPCSFAIDVGTRGQFLDTDWVEVEISDLTVGAEYTLSYLVAGQQNNAHATWAYFDNAESPPVPDFSTEFVDLASFGINTLSEGSLSQLHDTSTDADGDIAAWAWEVSGPGLTTPLTSELQHPLFIPPQNGVFDVTLTVTDSTDLSACASTIPGHSVAGVGPCLPIDLSPDALTGLVVGNVDPTVNALHVETLDMPGGAVDANLTGRFADGGWLDGQTATWVVADGAATPSSVVCSEMDAAAACRVDHTATLGTGLATAVATFTPAGPCAEPQAAADALACTTGTLTITDSDGGSGADSFTVAVVPADPSRHEASPQNDTLDLDPGDLPILPSDTAHLSFIQAPGDVDYFELQWRGKDGNQLFPANAELLVSLANLPNDYDLVLITLPPEESTAGNALFGNALFGNALFGNALFGNALFGNALFGNALFGNALFGNALFPFEMNGFMLTSLARLAFTGLDGTDVNSTDLSLAEVALGGLPPGAQVAGFSANSGLNDEVLHLAVDVPGTRVFAAVVGANGAFSSVPYTLQVEGSMPLETAALVDPSLLGALDPAFAESCAGTPENPLTPLVPAAQQTTSVVVDPASVANPHTLIITQRERLIEVYGQSAWDGLHDAIVTGSGGGSFLAHPRIQGKLISLPSDIYDAWDTNPCSVDAANLVTDQIRDIVMDELTAPGAAIEYVVIMGSDDMVPFRRVPDGALIGNQSSYLLDSFIEPGTPLFASLLGGFNLTDDFYGDLAPTPWQGRSLYVPDVALGRVVETPAEMEAQVLAFVASNGELLAETALITAYDFFQDGGVQTRDALLAGGLDATTLINDVWTADELRCLLLDDASGDLPGPSGVTAADCGLRDHSAVNAHYAHYAALAAGGFADSDADDIITSSQIAAADDSSQPGDADALARRLIFTVGCNAGFPAPDRFVQSIDPSILGVDPALDFAQAMAIQRSVFVASTGYGIGNDAGVSGTELLMAQFADAVVGGDTDVGQALRVTKTGFWAGLGAATVYDEKSMIQATLYGFPQYHVAAPGAPAGDLNEFPASELAVASHGEGAHQPVSVTLLGEDDSVLAEISAVLSEVTTPDGTYSSAESVVVTPGALSTVSAAGGVQSTAFRPLEPKLVVEGLTGGGEGAPADPIVAVQVVAATYADATGVDPVLDRPTFEWESGATEPQVCLPTFWPSDFASVNTIQLGADETDLVQALVLVLGQFQCSGLVDGEVRGLQRNVASLTLRLLRGSVDDLEPPLIESVDLSETNSVAVTVTASDDQGVAEILVLLTDDALGTTEPAVPVPPSTNPLVLSPPGGPGEVVTRTITIEDPTATQSLTVCVIDVGNNQTCSAGKGYGGLSVIGVDAGIDQAVAAGVPTYFQGTVFDFDQLDDPDHPLLYAWDFGDGQFASGPIRPDNPAILEYRTNPDGSVTFFVSHTYAGPIPSQATLKVVDGFGGIGVDSAGLTLCADSSADSTRGDANFVACRVTNDGSMITVTLVLAGAITDPLGQDELQDVQYRLRVDEDLDGAFEKQLRYLNGQTTGVPSLTVEIDGNEIAFTFDFADLGRCRSGPFLWSSETQVGLPGGPGVGIDDRMPDVGAFGHIFVNVAGEAPCALPDGYDTDAGVPLVAPAPGVLANDLGSGLTAVLVSGPSNGALTGTLQADGSFTYTPTDGFEGVDQFTYRASDGVQVSNLGTVTITVHGVNATPQCADLELATDEDTPGGVEPDCTDADDEVLTYEIVDPPEHGVAVIGSLDYTPDPDYFGPDVFTYRACDDEAASPACSEPATVTVTVQPVNDAPAADPQAVSTDQDTPVVVTLTGFDVDGCAGETYTAAVVAGPSSGSLSAVGVVACIGGDLSAIVTYTPDLGVSGADSFDFVFNDGTVDSVAATVDVTVAGANVAPTADGQTVVAQADGSAQIQLAGADANGCAGGPFSFTIVTQPNKGTVTPANGVMTCSGEGALGAIVTYTPGPGKFKGATFTFVISDGELSSTVATVTIVPAA